MIIAEKFCDIVVTCKHCNNLFKTSSQLLYIGFLTQCPYCDYISEPVRSTKQDKKEKELDEK